MTLTATLEAVWEEFQRGRIWECNLRDPTMQLDGLSDGENIYIDPRPAILETLVHELLHRQHRTWSERRVTAEARCLVVSMDEATKAKWWRAYRKVKRTRRPVDANIGGG